MFLKEIQNQPEEGMMGLAFKKLGENGHAVPEIMHLFRFKPNATTYLIRFTEEVMRGPSPLSVGLRELIGTYVSKKNNCSFCSCAHAPVAAELLGKDVVEGVLEDLETSTLGEKEKALLRYCGKVAENPACVNSGDISRVKSAGWSEEAIYDALTVSSVFKFYNTWNNGSGVQNMRASDYAGSAKRLVDMGYCMDFTFKSVLKVMWVGRNETTLSDFKMLAGILLRKAVPFGRLFFRQSNAEPTASPAPLVVQLGKSI